MLVFSFVFCGPHRTLFDRYRAKLSGSRAPVKLLLADSAPGEYTSMLTMQPDDAAGGKNNAVFLAADSRAIIAQLHQRG